MNRILSLGLVFLSFGIAWLMFIFGYIISPMYGAITAPQEGFFGDGNIELIKISKVFFWGVSACFIAGLMAAAGAIVKKYTTIANLIAVGVLMIAVFTSVLLSSPIFFVVI